jgi:cyclase
MRVLLPRVIPCLLLKGGGLVKTTKFKNPVYLGDPRNVVKIFNEKEVDELILLDINATPDNKPIQFQTIYEIVSEAFMPVAYGGGIRSLEHARRMLALGVEKIVLNSYAFENPAFVTQAAASFGSSSVVVSIDAKRNLFGKYEVFVNGGRKNTHLDPVQHAMHMQERGAGEILINSIDRDGAMQGYDLNLIRAVSAAVSIPVIACGGAGAVDHFAEAVNCGATAVAAGSLFVFQGKHRAVLISYPQRALLEKVLGAT